MISTIFIAEKFQIGAGLSGYVAEMNAAFCCASLGIVPTVRHADRDLAGVVERGSGTHERR